MIQRLVYLLIFTSLNISLFSQVSGTVFYDYNSNGLKETIEPGVKNVQVAAYDATGNQIGTTQLTSATGTYSISVSSGVKVRLMFTSFPAGYYDGKKGSSSNTNVQYVTSPISTANLGILNPYYYCQDLPKLTMSMMTNGNPLGGGTSGTASSLFSFPFDASGRNNNGGTNATSVAINSQTGAIWGQCFQKETNTLFLSSLYRRHAGFGPLGISGIYKVDNMNSSPVVSNFVAISSLNSLFSFGTDAHSGLPAASSTPNNDASVFTAVGKNGIGDMDISEDGKWLYMVNLKDKNLYGVFINNPYRTPTATDVDKYVIPNPACSNSEFVPFAVKCYGTYVYVGVVCTAETSKNLADLKASVYRLDPITGTWTNIITGTTFPLNFGRGLDYGTNVNWQPWSSTASVIHQPILAGIEFNENNNDMILSFMDRAALQWGYQNYPPTGSTLTNGLATGDILRLCQPSGSSTWTIEANGSGCSVTGSGVGNSQGPGGGEFFNDWATASSNAHDQPSFGGLIKKPGGVEVFSTSLDPINISNSGGLLKYSLSNGAKSTGYELYTSTTVSNFGNASSLGDIEILCDANPIEFGNLIWNDANENGRQDPNENGIDGVTVQIYDDLGILKGTTVTSNGGQYYFNNTNVTGGLITDVSYEIRVPISGALLYLTSTNPNAFSDEYDSDATTTIDKAYAFIFTGGTTNTNHNLDFGFKCGTNEVLPQDFDVCTGSTFQLCSDDLGATATYLWSTGQTTRCINVTINNPITYTITVTASNGCQGVDNININTQPYIFVDAGGDVTICQGVTTTLMSQAYTGLAPFTYSWNNGLGTGANKNVTPSTNTTYTVTVTDATGCTGTDAVVVFVRISPTANAGPDQTIASGSCATLSGSATGGTTPYNYIWSNGLGTGQSKQACPTVTTNYTLTVSDFFGCTKTDQVIVNVGAVVTVNLGPDVTICGGTSSTITATGAGGTSPYTYAWSNSLGTGASKTVSPIVTTTYTVTVTDSKGATNTDALVVIVNPKVIVSTGSDQSICTAGTATLVATVTSGTSPYSYIWSNGQSTSSITVSPTVNTTYTVTVTDNKTCTGIDTIVVFVNPKPSVFAGVDVTICNLSSTNLTAGVSGGTSPFTYQWSNGQLTNVISVSPSVNTTYTVTVTDSKLCSNFDQVVVNVNPNVIANAGTDQNFCAPATTTLNGTASNGTSPFTYVWSTGASTQSITVSPSVSTTYTVTITDAKSCTHSDNVVVFINPIPTVNAGLDKNNCQGSSTTITAATSNGTAPYTYAWSNNANTQSITVSPMVNTTYTVTVTDSKLCSSSDQVVINAVTNPTANAGVDKSICSGGSTNLSNTASGGLSPYSYSWSNGSNTQSISVNPSITTTYTASVTDVNGCIGTDQVIVNVNPAININAGADQSICGSGTATMNASVTGGTSPYTYLWSNNATTQSITVAPNSTTSYTVTVTDSKGCSNTDQVIINVGSSLSVNAGNDQSICLGSSISLNASVTGGTSPFNYIWSTGATTAGINVSPSVKTTYTVTITDVNTCSKADTVVVSVNNMPTINAGADQTICGTGFATLSAMANGGLSPYTYLWNSGQTTASITINPTVTTSYTVTVSDANNCSSSDLAVVNVTSKPIINAGPDQTICGSGSVSITSSVTFGTSPFTYLWSNSATTASIIVNPSITTTYTVTVTDAKACTNTDVVIININPKPIVNVGADLTLCGSGSASINAIVSSGSSPFTYLWSNSATTASITVSPASTTTYTVTVTDSKLCTGTDVMIINVGTKPTVNAGIDQTICQGKTTNLTAVGSGGTSPYTYLWNTTGNTSTISVAPVKDSTFTVTVTDAKGCTNSDMVIVKVNPKPTVNAGADKNVCGSTTVSLSGSATGGTSPYSYKWSTTASTAYINVKPSTNTTYTLTVTDSKTCSASDQVIVFVNPKPSVNAGLDVSICPSTSTTLTAVASGGTSPYSYNWNNGLGGGATKTVSPTSKTSYTVTVTDSKVCSATDQVIVTIKTCLAFTDRNSYNSFELIPNPAHESVTLKLAKEISESDHFRFVSMNGEVISKAEMEFEKVSKNELRIDLKKMSGGMYIFEYITSEEVFKTNLIIVNN